MSQETKATKGYRQVTAEQLRERFELMPDGVLMWRTPPRNCPDLVGKIAGRKYSRAPYWRITIKGQGTHRSRVVFCMVHGYWPGEVNHINQNSLDDRPENLREVTHQQNAFNMKPRSAKASGLPTGVHRMKDKFQARLGLNMRRVHLGTFASVEEAKQAYLAARRQHYGEFA